MAYDKKLHFGAGLLISVAGGYFFMPVVGLGLACAAGILKELWDLHGYGEFDPLDLAATIAGGVAGFALLEVVSWML